ncbi:MAG: glycosyltransferase [Betaproteobacteria bacterium]|nr:glycosyltransferase [Betaproteobacteria bacterium]
MAIRKVGFILVGDRATASARLRGHNVIDFLPECAEQYNPANRDLYQVVVFQKRYEERDIALASDLRNRGKKIVFDMCDNYLSDVRKRPLLERICRIAHVTTTASEQLEELYAPLSNRVVMIADGLLDTAKSKAHGPKFQPVLLWFGNHGERVLGEERGMGDLLMLRKPLEYLAKHNVLLKVVSNSREKYQRLVHPLPIPSVYREWAISTIEDELLSAEAVLIPVKVDDFSRCKSNNRAAEAMLRMLPVVASPIPSYSGTIEHAKNGFLCSGPGEWSAVLDELLSSPARRQQVGMLAREKIAKDHLMKDVCRDWRRLFDELAH